MISKLAKSMALFFADKNLIAAEDKEVYAYGAELLLSTVFNLIIALVIVSDYKYILAVSGISYIICYNKDLCRGISCRHTSKLYADISLCTGIICADN